MSKYQAEFLSYYETHHEAFARFCHAKAYGLVEAEDLISESVLVALEKFDALKNKQAFLSFLFSIASNLIKKTNRRLKFSGKYDSREAFLIKDEGIDAETRLDVGVLYDALNELPSSHKEALILFEISGFSIKEVAEIQSIKISAVKQRLKRGREKLAAIFKSDQLRGESINQRSATLLTVFF